jgi:hypothetical protein
LLSRSEEGTQRLPGTEEIVEQCNPDQGCGNSGKCVDACTASALAKGSLGCDFWTVTPPSLNDGQGNCFAAMIANTWDRPVAMSADFGSAPLDISTVTYTVSRNELGQSQAGSRKNCPMPPAADLRYRPPGHGAGEGVPHQDRRARLVAFRQNACTASDAGQIVRA